MKHENVIAALESELDVKLPDEFDIDLAKGNVSGGTTFEPLPTIDPTPIPPPTLPPPLPGIEPGLCW